MQAPEVILSPSSLDTNTRPEHQAAPRQLTVTIPVVPAFLHRWFGKLKGVCLIVLALLGGIALATWTISDPSLTFANGSAPDNWLGFWGASFADIAMQFFGFAAIALLVPPLIWGLQKLSLQPMTHLLPRMVCWIAGLVVLSAGLACISIPEGWPLQVGLGGVIGDAVLGIPRAFTGSYPSGLISAILFTLFIAPAYWLMVRACDLHRGITLPKMNAPRSEDVELLMEQELSDGATLSDAGPDGFGWDWTAIFTTPLGLVMHMGYSFSAMWRKRRGGKSNAKRFNDGWVQPLTEAVDGHQ